MWNSSIKGFAAYLQLERSLSPNSVEAYLRDVQKLTGYLELQGKAVAPEEVVLEDLQGFIRYLAEFGLEPASQARLISAIKGFYKYLLTENLITMDPTALLEAPKMRRKLPDVLSFAEIESMIGAIDLSRPEGHRNKAMLEVLYSCGLRVSELVGLRKSWLFLDTGFIRVIGKGDKERLVPIGREAIHYLQIYDQQRRNATAAVGYRFQSVIPCIGVDIHIFKLFRVFLFL